MSETTFEFVSIIMRYWFIFLVLAILYYVVRNALQEYRFTKASVDNGVMHMYWLKMVECPDKQLIGNMVGLRHNNVIGSKRNNDICLPYPGVSKEHCQLKFKGKTFKLTDLKSTYGTFVNGEEIKRNFPLQNGDVLTIGAISVKYVVERGEQA